MTELLVGILATWRIAAWLYYNGDAKWLQRARERYEWLTCFWCVATRVGLIIGPCVVWQPWIFFPIALSGGALLLTQAGRTIWRDMVDVRKVEDSQGRGVARSDV